MLRRQCWLKYRRRSRRRRMIHYDHCFAFLSSTYSACNRLYCLFRSEIFRKNARRRIPTVEGVRDGSIVKYSTGFIFIFIWYLTEVLSFSFIYLKRPSMSMSDSLSFLAVTFLPSCHLSGEFWACLFIYLSLSVVSKHPLGMTNVRLTAEISAS